MHIVTGEEMKKIDRCTMEEVGLSGMLLMENAGRAVVQKLCERLKPEDRIVVVAGAGNNGGDGFVIARVLFGAGYDVELWLIPPVEKIKGDARKHLDVLRAAGVCFHSYPKREHVFSERIRSCTVIVDALLGTGISGPSRSPHKEIIAEINDAQAWVVAVDLPSGVSSDGAAVVGEAVWADDTVTLQCPKVSTFLYPTAEYYGTWETVDIGIPRGVISKIADARILWRTEDVRRTLPKRAASSYKGNYGRGLLMAGSLSMTGAAVLAAKAALRAGAGLLTVGLPDVIHPMVSAQVVESTYLLCPSKDGAFSGMFPYDLSFDAVAVGPGLGRGEGSGYLVEYLIRDCEAPLLIDADGLSFFERFKGCLKDRSAPTILTPHPGEMARLLGTSVEEVQNRRFEASWQFATEYGVYLVLKGPYTIITAPEGNQYVNTTGNAALAKGGTGDVLTGLILAFAMQHESMSTAICNAVCLHGYAADLLVEETHSQMDVLATDVISAIPRAFRRL